MQLVADANVLLSAVIGGRAALVLRHDRVEQVFIPLALTLKLPVWSNDNDFEDARVEWYTTAELLKTLDIESR